MVPVREWSCSLHNYPETHECDCDHCELPYYTCDQCAAAKWVNKLDADGNVVMREATTLDLMTKWLVRDLVSSSMFSAPLVSAPLSTMPKLTTK